MTNRPLRLHAVADYPVFSLAVAVLATHAKLPSFTFYSKFGARKMVIGDVVLEEQAPPFSMPVR